MGLIRGDMLDLKAVEIGQEKRADFSMTTTLRQIP